MLSLLEVIVQKFNRVFGGGIDINILKIELNIFEVQIAAAEARDDQRQVQILKNQMESATLT
jgi:hypothetical protein